MALETKAHSLAKEELGGKGEEKGRERQRETWASMASWTHVGILI